MKPSSARFLLSALAATLLAPLASATWSILIVDTSTGEIAVAQSTCIVGPNLRNKLAVVIPGVGGACVQAWWDNSGVRRMLIWDDLLEGRTPDEIIAHLNTLGSPHLYQYGIVDALARTATYTGSAAGAWAGGRIGAEGSLAWAIQGNVLAGEGVAIAAEDAIRNTPGALPEKLVAAMLAAAGMGGDGRCSCSPSAPDSCGTPPPGFDLSTDKAAHVGFMVVARMGDTAGVCDGGHGCANGEYYMNFNVVPGQAAPPDPIVEMEGSYLQWRAALIGRPDQLESQKQITPPQVPGNGATVATLDVQLADWRGDSITSGGAVLRVAHAPSSAGLASIGPILDHGDGSYAIELTAGAGQGTDTFEIWVDDGVDEILLYPLPTLLHTPTLVADVPDLSIGSGGTVGLDLYGPPTQGAPRPYLVLGSLSGTEPGRGFGSIVLPLNADRFLLYTWVSANHGALHDTRGLLAADGTAHAAFVTPPGFFPAAFLGSELAFAWLTMDVFDFASNPARVSLVP